MSDTKFDWPDVIGAMSRIDDDSSEARYRMRARVGDVFISIYHVPAQVDCSDPWVIFDSVRVQISHGPVKLVAHNAGTRKQILRSLQSGPLLDAARAVENLYG